MPAYHPQRIEPKWQLEWERNKTFRAIDLDPSRPKLYVLDMFPYPSGGAPRGPSGRLYSNGYLLPLQADAGVQRPAPHGLGRLRAACRAIRGFDEYPSENHDTNEHRYISARSRRSGSRMTGTARSIRRILAITGGRSGFSSRSMTPGTTTISSGPTGAARSARERAGPSPSCRFRLALLIRRLTATRRGWPTGPSCR